MPTTAKPMRPYIRVSAVMGREDLQSPELQLFEIDKLAKREGATLLEPIVELDKSGKSFAKRKIKDIIDEIKAGTCGGVYLLAWDRWGRNLRESLEYIAQVEAVGGQVRSATEDFDTSTDAGEFSRDTLLLIAQFRSRQLGAGWKRTQDKRRREGLPHTATERFGYAKAGKSAYHFDPRTAPHLRHAYDEVLAGVAVRQIAFRWNALGLRTTRGALWSHQSLQKCMDTGFAAGWIRERSKPPKADKGGASGPRHYDVWRQGAHPALITQDTWKAYKERRLNADKVPPRLATRVHALSGLLYCGICSARLNAGYCNSKHVWVCPNYRDKKQHRSVTVANSVAIRQVLAWLDETVEGGEGVTEEAERIAKAAVAKGDAEKWASEINRLKRKRLSISDNLVSERIEKEDADALLAEVREDLRAAEAEYASAKAAEGVSPGRLQAFTTIRKAWGGFTTQQQNAMLSTLTQRIIVQPSDKRYGLATLRPIEVWATEEPPGGGSVTAGTLGAVSA